MAQAHSNAINWFEIPVRDLDRAQTFYERLLAVSLRRENMGPHTLAVFPYSDDAVGGCLVTADDSMQPAAQGAVVYLNAGSSLDAVLDRVESAGGRIATPRVDLPDGMGCFAHITDTEGNRFGIHALA